ncbi:hypothetical protein MBANPS3_011566 [Mucor bainieri]
MATFNSLNAELLIAIFGYLDSSRAIGECRLVCKAWDEPAAISMLRKPIAIEDEYLIDGFIEYLKAHPNRVYKYYGLELSKRLLQQAFTPNLEELTVKEVGFSSVRSNYNEFYDGIVSIANESSVKFGKLKKIIHDCPHSDRFDLAYGQSLLAFKESIQHVKLSFYKIAEVQNVIYRLGEFKKLYYLTLKGYFDNLESLDAVLKGCHHLKTLDLIIEDFLYDGEDYDSDGEFDIEPLLVWDKENVEQVKSLKTLTFSGWGYPTLVEYLAYKYPNTTHVVYDIFRLSSAYENKDDGVSKNIELIFNAFEHAKTIELHYQIPSGDDLEEVCQVAEGDLNSMRLRYTELGAMDTMLMHLTSTLSKNGARSTQFDVEIPPFVDEYYHLELIEAAGLPLFRLELDFLNFSMQERDPFYRKQLQKSEEPDMLFGIWSAHNEIKQIKVLGHLIDVASDETMSEFGDEVLLESLELCGAQVTEDALETIGQYCQKLHTLVLTNCQVIPGGDNMYHIKMHSICFDRFKFHLVFVDDIAREQQGFFEGTNMHAEDYLGKIWMILKKTWLKPCYLWLAVSNANKKIYFEIVPGDRNPKLISKNAFDSRKKGSFVLHFNCHSIKSLEIDIRESYLSLDEQAIATALESNLSYALEQDDIVAE